MAHSIVSRYDRIKSFLCGLLLVAAFLILGATLAFSQSSIKVYPSNIRVDVGKTRTVTAVAFDAAGKYRPNQKFVFSQASGLAATASVRHSPEGDTEAGESRLSDNLAEISGLHSGMATFTASLNGSAGSPFTVTVVDPADAPQAVIGGDNEAENNLVIRARVGEAIEVNADNSSGVKSVEWFWGDGDRSSGVLSSAHAYLYPATYQLGLRIANSSGLVSESMVTVIITDRPAATRMFTVTTMAALLAAYNQCTGGEDIIIPAGTALTGSVTLPARSFSDFVTIRSSAVMPDMTVRVNPGQSDLATLRGSFPTEIPMTIKNRATKIRLSGLKFEPFHNGDDTIRNYYMLQIGEAFTQTTTADNPHNIILDHCVIDPPNDTQVVHGILNDGYKISMIASWFGNIKSYGAQDSQAVFALDGRGAHVYNNTYFEAASESIIYGGAANRIDGNVPTNIEFRRCVFTKPAAWRQLPNNSVGDSLNEKNLFESKNGRRIYVEGSMFANQWDADRSQFFAICLKSVPDQPNGEYGSPWSVTEEIVFENNRVSHVNGGVALTREFYRAGIAYDPLKPRNISFVNTLFDDLTFGRWGNTRTWSFYVAGTDDLSVRHVSVIDAVETPDEEGEMMLDLDSVSSYRPEIVNSILPLNYYGIRNTCGEGIAAMNVGTSGWLDGSGNSCGAMSGPNAGTWSISGNVLPKMRTYHDAKNYPVGNFYPDNYDGIAMQAYRNCGLSSVADPCNSTITDFSLANSPYRNSAADGADPGIDAGVLSDRLRCTASGDTRTCVSTTGDAAPPPAQISGRVTTSEGLGIRNATIIFTNMGSVVKTVTTSSFGYYTVDGILPGGAYTISIPSKQYRFAPRTVQVNGSVSGIDFVGLQ